MSLRFAILALAGCVLLGGCSGGGDKDDPSLQELADIAFADQAALDRATVEEGGTSGSSSTSLEIVMDADASAEQAAAAAVVARTFSDEHAGTGRWISHLYVGEPPTTVQVEVYPAVIESAEEDVRAVFDLSETAGVNEVATAGGTPYVRATDIDSLTTLIPALRRSTLWSDGGSVQAEEGRLRIMDSPARVTQAQLMAIVDAARTYPAADFALEAAATGERYPELYINRLTAKQAAVITSTFTDAALRSDNAEGYELDFTMRAFGADGNTVDSGGTFGRR